MLELVPYGSLVSGAHPSSQQRLGSVFEGWPSAVVSQFLGACWDLGICSCSALPRARHEERGFPRQIGPREEESPGGKIAGAAQHV